MPCAHLFASFQDMMRRLNTLLTSLVLTLMVIAGLSSCSDTKDDDWGKDGDEAKNENKNDVSAEPALARLEFPNVSTLFGNPISTRTSLRIYSNADQYGINYSVLWDIDKKAQRWSAWQMTKNMKSSQGLNSYFTEDPDLPFSYRVNDSQSFYSGSGFDRGHICPNADRQYSKEANQQTYYYTNMQPQYHMFNAGPRLSGGEQDWSRKSPWLRLEEKVRTWAKGSDTEVLYVVKGGTIEDNQLLTKIKSQMPVPKYFFVALLMKNNQTQPYKAIGFLIEHDNADHADDPLSNYAMNIRQLEQFTGFDFFCNLPDDVEEHVETLPLENVLRAWKP